MRKNKRWLVILLLLATVQMMVAKEVLSGHDSLLKMPSATLMEKGRSSFSQRKAAEALACFTIVSERRADSDEEQQLRIRALNNCACVYKYFYFDYIEAYDYFSRAYDLCEQIQYDDFLPVIMVNMGDLLNDYSLSYGSKPLAQQAQDLFEKCIGKAVETRNWELLTTSFFNLANQNYQLDLKKYYVLFSKEIPDSTPDLQYVRLQYLGIQHMQRKEYAKARKYFEQQLQCVTTPWTPERDSLASYVSIATTYEREGLHADAVGYLEKALQLTEEKDLSDLSTAICRQLSEQHRLLGNTELADRYHQRYIEMMEKTHASQLSHVAELNYIRELKKQEEATQELEQRQQLQQIFLLAAIIVIAVIVIAALLLWQKNRQLRERNRSLYEKNVQVMRIEAVEQEQRKTYSKSSLNDEQRETLVGRIQEVLANPDIICQQDFTLNKLAKMINSNTTYVSQVINETYGMAFSNLLGSRRVHIACQWMEDPARVGSITIEAIASASGFKSRTAFINAFKRETGLTPSEYIRLAASKTR